MWKMAATALCVLTPAALWAAEAEPNLLIREAKSGQLLFKSPFDKFQHRFAVVAGSATPATISGMTVADLSDDAGAQIKPEFGWSGQAPTTIELTKPAELYVKASLPQPGIYRTEIEILYAGKFLRLPLQIERLASPASDLSSELPIDATAGSKSVQLLLGDASTTIELALRGTKSEDAQIAWCNVTSLLRKGTGSQLFDTSAHGHVTLPQQTLLVGRRDLKKLQIAISTIEGPGAYEGKVLLGSPKDATKEVAFSFLVKRCWLFASFIIGLGVLLSYGVRRWLQKGRARAVILRELAQLRDRLTAVPWDTLSDTDRQAIANIAAQLKELSDTSADGSEITTATVELLRRRLRLLQAVIESRRQVALFTPEKRKSLSAELDTIARGLSDRLKESELEQQEAKLRGLDLSRALRETLTKLLESLDQRLTNREQRHLELRERWREIRKSLANAKGTLDQGKLDAAKTELGTAYRAFSRVLGGLLRQLLGKAPREVPEKIWSDVRTDIENTLAELDKSQDAEQANELHARAVRRYLRITVPGLVAAVRREAASRPAKKQEFDELAGRVAALSVDDVDGDELCSELSEQLVALLDANPIPDTGERPVGTLRSAAVEMSAAREASAALSEDNTPMGALRTLLPAADWVAARIRRSDQLSDVALLLLAVLTGLKILWMSNATWGDCDDVLTAFLWGAGVHSVGQGAARGILGLAKDFAKLD